MHLLTPYHLAFYSMPELMVTKKTPVKTWKALTHLGPHESMCFICHQPSLP